MMHITNFSKFLESFSEILIRKATNEDYPEIKKISGQHRSYLPFVMRVAIEDSITRGEVIIAEEYKKVIGFIHFHKRRDGITTIHEIGVNRDYMNRGVGKKLISQLEKPIQLKVTQDNPANDFYKKLGFDFKKIVSGKKRDLNLYLLEGIYMEDNPEIIEDCLLDFCDDYNLDIDINKGHLVNGSYIPIKLLPDLLKMAKDDKKSIDIIECYRITLLPKSHRYSDLFGSEPKLTEIGEKWKDEINSDFKDAVGRVEKMTNLRSSQVPNILKTFWSITFYLVD